MLSPASDALSTVSLILTTGRTAYGYSAALLSKVSTGAASISDQVLTSAGGTIADKRRSTAGTPLLVWGRTIRGQILFAFLFMAAIGSAVGLHASYRIEHGGALVTETYDGPLMAINYARAASADFALMQLAALRLAHAQDQASRSSLEIQIGELKRSLTEDLGIAADRSQSSRADQAAERALVSIEAWDRARQTAEASGSGLDPLARYVQAADREIELLVNYTAGEGFTYRQRARAAVSEDWWLNLAALVAALLFSALLAWLLAQHIVRQVASASQLAGRIAIGQFDDPMPEAGLDELGALLASLAAMRNNLRAMMQREVAQRQSAQGRLLDAVESSHEGIVVVDCDGRVVIANDQAIASLEWHGQTKAHDVSGMDWAALSSKLPAPDTRGEVAMDNGCWLNISRSPTREGGFVAVIADITHIKQQGVWLEGMNLRLDTALANMSQGLCLFDADGRLIVVNDRYSELFRIPKGRVRLGLTQLDLIQLRFEYGNHAGTTVQKLTEEKMAAVERRVPGAFSMPLSDGRVLSVLLRPAAKGGWAITYEDVTERRQAEERLTFMARHDALTRLPNRAFFSERMNDVLQGVEIEDGLAVLCLDLDRFKIVNDTLGHAMGDLLLQLVAKRLQGCIRAEDMVCRMGGDEFTIIQAGPYSVEATMALAKRVTETTNEPYDLEGSRASIGVSIGVAVAPHDGVTADVLVRNADLALYRAKAEGRGAWRFYEEEMDTGLRARDAMGRALRNALANGELDLCYQPIYDLDFDRVRAFEALLRWNSPEFGAVPPSEFIPMAEELGLMVPLGRWVLQQACAEAAGWPSHISVSVNVSPAQVDAGQLLEAVTEALRSARLPATRLNLEVTETVLFSKSTLSSSVIRELRDLGVQTSLDDFGTGYSSLSYLATFPIDQIKIDQSFIRNLQDAGTAVIVRAIIGIADSLSLRVVAEGVETHEQLHWLRDAGCDDIQGYLVAKPTIACDLQGLMILHLSEEAVSPG